MSGVGGTRQPRLRFDRVVEGGGGKTRTESGLVLKQVRAKFSESVWVV